MLLVVLRGVRKISCKKMLKKLLISKAINDFYNKSSEEDRLSIGLGPLEFERNKTLIQKFLPERVCKIVDIGGGTGKYSEWLSKMGHKVYMIEPVKKHVNLALKRSEGLKNKFKVIHGEAKNLDLPDNYADITILHGPLYHLQEKADRLKAISEAKRITKPGGTILGYAINYTASTIVALLQGVIHDEKILNMCHSELTTGIHHAPENMPGILTEAYYHKPKELQAEFEEVKLYNIQLFSVEGIIWLDKNFYSSRSDLKKYNNLLEINKITENDTNLIAFSPHMMIAAIKL